MANLKGQVDMVQGKRRIQQHVAPVMWSPDQVTDLSFVTPATKRYARASVYVGRQVHEYMLALWDLEIPVDDAMLTRMLDAAERREQDAADREGREPEFTRKPSAQLFHDQVVYYMRMDRLVKIGTSGNLRTRLASLTTQGVMAVEWGGRELERSRHNQFADLHSHLEWFHLAGSLADHVAIVRERFEAEQGLTVEQWLVDRGVTNPVT